MQQYEYRVVPAPRRGEKARGLKTTPERFAYALTELMNELAAQGWEYLRADTLPCEERSGLTGRTTNFQNLLVFRRTLEHAVSPPHIVSTHVPAPPAPVVAPVADVAPVVVPVPVPVAAQPAQQPVLTMPADPLAKAVRLGAIRADAGNAPPVGPAKTGRDGAES